MWSATSAGSGRSTNAGVSIACTMRDRKARSRRAINVANSSAVIGVNDLRSTGWPVIARKTDSMRIRWNSVSPLEGAAADATPRAAASTSSASGRVGTSVSGPGSGTGIAAEL